MKVLLIGASSFIGVYTANELLQQGVSVIGTGRNPRFSTYYEKIGIPYFYLDIKKEASFQKLDEYKFDVVVVCAARMPANIEKNVSEDDTAEYIDVNVVGIARILEYCRKRGINRIISLISSFNIRNNRLDVLVKEDTALNFSYKDDHAGYVISQNGTLELLKYYNIKYSMKNICFRIPAVYGVGPHGMYCKDGVYKKSGIQIFIDKASKGEPIEIFGDPETKKDIVYVKDVASIIVKAISADEAKGLYNICYDKSFSILEMVEGVIKNFSQQGNFSKMILCADKENSGGFPHMDNTKAKKELGFKSQYETFYDIMKDYKCELNRGVYTKIFGGKE